MKSTMYFWKDDEVVTHTGENIVGHTPRPYLNCYCVDAYSNADIDPETRYGMYAQDPEIAYPEWRHIPLTEFPPAFRIRLLVLGIQ